MNVSQDLARFISTFINTLKDDALKRREDTFDRIAELHKKEQITAAELDDLLKQIKLKSSETIAAMEIEKNARLAKLNAKYEKEIQNYREYLASLDDLKQKLEQSFPKSPPTLILIVYHHATHLLHNMWDAENKHDFLRSQNKFMDFLTIIGEDTMLLETEEKKAIYPAKTIEYIKKNK